MPSAPYCERPTPCPCPVPDTTSGLMPRRVARLLPAPSERIKPPASAPVSLKVPPDPLKVISCGLPDSDILLTTTLASGPTFAP